MTAGGTDDKGLFDRYVLGLTRVLVLGGFGAMFGIHLMSIIMDRFWPAGPRVIEYLGGALGVAGAFYSYRILKRWGSLEDIMGRL